MKAIIGEKIYYILINFKIKVKISNIKKNLMK